MNAWIRKHYHWIIAGVLFLQLAICGGSDNNLSGLHLIPVTEYLGISRTQYALAFSLRSCISMAMTFCSGMVLERFRYKRVALWACTMYIAGYCLLTFMSSSWMLVAGAAFLGMGATFCGTSGANFIVSAWFRKHRGTVLGLITAATGIGGSVLCLGQTRAMETYSWRASYMLCILLLAGIFLLMLATIRNTPQSMGLPPYGQDAAPEDKQKHRLPDALFPGKNMAQLWRSVSFYLMLSGILLASLGLYIVFYAVVPYLTDIGFSATQAGSIQSTMLILLSVSKLLAGWLSDRIGPKWVNWGFIAMGVTGILCFIAIDSMAMAFLAAVVFTFSLSTSTVMIPLLALPLFGYRAQTQYTGVFLSVTYIATTSASLITNGIYDAVGSYRPAFYLAAGLCAAALVLFPILYRLAQKEFTNQ